MNSVKVYDVYNSYVLSNIILSFELFKFRNEFNVINLFYFLFFYLYFLDRYK